MSRLGPPVSTYVRSGQVPPYFVTLTPSDAVVHLTVSGAAVATIRPSLPGGTVVAVTAAGDDRTFVLGRAGPGPQGGHVLPVPAGFLRPARCADPAAHVGGGREDDDRPGPVPRRHQARDRGRARGRRPAGQAVPGHGGPARTWSATGGTIGDHFASRSLSWPASQRTLAFNWSAGQTTSVRLLNLGTAGGSLLAASRPAVTLANTAELGQTLYQCRGHDHYPGRVGDRLSQRQDHGYRQERDHYVQHRIPEFSATTGRLIRITGHWPQKQDDPFVYDLLWSGASGQVLIGAIHSAGRDWVGVISGNRFTPLNVAVGPWARTTFGTW